MQDVIGEVGFGATFDALHDEHNEVCLYSDEANPYLYTPSYMSVIRRCLTWYVRGLPRFFDKR
jgi:hypothetical protein